MKITENCSEFDYISTKLLEMLIHEIEPVRSHIFNRYLLTGIVPLLLEFASQ